MTCGASTGWRPDDGYRDVLNLAAFHESVATAMGGRTSRREDVVVTDLESIYHGHGSGDVELWSPRE
jgi:hypothetical protein